MKARAFVTLIVALNWVAAYRPIGAQTRVVVSGVVQNASADSLPYARIQATAAGLDTTIRANSHGRFVIRLPHGTVHFRVSQLGFAVSETDVIIRDEQPPLALSLRENAQQVGAINVRARFTGIRGIVGDSTTMKPIAGVKITSVRRGKQLLTDSTGRFVIDLPRAEQTMLQLEADGYLARPAIVDVPNDGSVDVILFMTAGKNPKYLHQALVDFNHRTAWHPAGSFIASREDLAHDDAKTLADATMVIDGQSRGHLDTSACLFIDGVPSRTSSLAAIRVADVESVEMIRRDTDDTRTLQSRWPGGACAGSKPSKRGDGPWVSVWLRK